MSALLLLIPVAMFVAFLITFVVITRCLAAAASQAPVPGTADEVATAALWADLDLGDKAFDAYRSMTEARSEAEREHYYRLTLRCNEARTAARREAQATLARLRTQQARDDAS